MVTKVPLGEMPIIDVPFHHVAIDRIGPITPGLDNGSRYIVSIVDFGTKYHETLTFPILKRLAITLMYCSRLHAWWSIQSWLATLLSCLIAGQLVGLQTL